MPASSEESPGLARGVVGSARVIRAVRTEFREEFRLWRHLLIPGAAALLFLFPLWGILLPAAFKTLGRVFMPADR